jgi:hypothetical protein
MLYGSPASGSGNQGVYIIRWDFNDFFMFHVFSPSGKMSFMTGALQSQKGKNQVKNEDLLELLYGCM